MIKYVVFARRSWKENPAWPRGLEPDPTPPRQGRKIGTAETSAEAREMCAEWQHRAQISKQDRRLGLMAEFTKVENY